MSACPSTSDIKTFTDMAYTIARVSPAHSMGLTKKRAASVRTTCLYWLDTAPLSENRALLQVWGHVVAVLVRCEDVLRAGKSSVSKPRAAHELAQWLDWIETRPTSELFAFYRRKQRLYASVCHCASALIVARPYSRALHEALEEHRWSAVTLLGLLVRCRDAHSAYRKSCILDAKAAVADAPEEPWLQALLAVAKHTDWSIPNDARLHPLWGAIPELAALEQQRDVCGQAHYDKAAQNDEDMRGLIAKLSQDLPRSASDAILFAQHCPELVSSTSLHAIMALDLRDTSSWGAVFAWLRLHTRPTPPGETLRNALRQRYPAMDDVFRSYVQMVSPDSPLEGVEHLLPAWDILVLGKDAPVEEDICGNVFAT